MKKFFITFINTLILFGCSGNKVTSEQIVKTDEPNRSITSHYDNSADPQNYNNYDSFNDFPEQYSSLHDCTRQTNRLRHWVRTLRAKNQELEARLRSYEYGEDQTRNSSQVVYNCQNYYTSANKNKCLEYANSINMNEQIVYNCGNYYDEGQLKCVEIVAAAALKNGRYLNENEVYNCGSYGDSTRQKLNCLRAASGLPQR